METSKSKSTFGMSGVSGEGYERDVSSGEQRKATQPIAHKRIKSTKATSDVGKHIKAALTDSGYEQDLSSGIEASSGKG